jgi:hypothetical protein
MHVQTHAWDPAMIVDAIKKHQTSQDWDGVWKRWRRSHNDDEIAEVAAADDGESEEGKCREQFSLPYCDVLASGRATKTSRK